ncbi:hypothetical protein ABIB15_000367 [Marisediminicola sp. UYEF4]|uniref:hypothetical protein n=1 Tax=Marisediminicola sp. UYEF4 TaxID=1756384 RepID=UPI003395E662
MRLRATSIVLAGLIAASLSGCTFGAVQATQLTYDPSDGIGAEVGDVQVRNALLLTEDGETAALVVALVNSGDTGVQLAVSWDAESGRVERTVSVPAGETVSLGAEADVLALEGVDAQPGSLFPVYFQYGDEEGQELDVPVLDGALNEYADLVPGE